MRRLWPSFSRRIRFSVQRYWMTSCCRRFIQPASAIAKKVQGFQVIRAEKIMAHGRQRNARMKLVAPRDQLLPE